MNNSANDCERWTEQPSNMNVTSSQTDALLSSSMIYTGDFEPPIVVKISHRAINTFHTVLRYRSEMINDSIGQLDFVRILHGVCLFYLCPCILNA